MRHVRSVHLEHYVGLVWCLGPVELQELIIYYRLLVHIILLILIITFLHIIVKLFLVQLHRPIRQHRSLLLIIAKRLTFVKPIIYLLLIAIAI